MSKILILTSFTDNIRWNNYGKCDYGDFSSKNHLNYANKHGYSYHRCWEDGKHNYIYHAGGDTSTKLQRVKRVLNSRLN